MITIQSTRKLPTEDKMLIMVRVANAVDGSVLAVAVIVGIKLPAAFNILQTMSILPRRLFLQSFHHSFKDDEEVYYLQTI